jgi:hypothetical protein
MLEDEDKVAIAITENFQVSGDPEYLSLALKNLIDNAVKYATAYPVTITASARTICVANPGKPLEAALVHYLQPFRRGETAQNRAGFGLGLSIVTKVLQRHAFALTYDFIENTHRFCVDFGCAPPLRVRAVVLRAHRFGYAGERDVPVHPDRTQAAACRGAESAEGLFAKRVHPAYRLR